MEIDNLSDKMRSYCNRQQRKLEANDGKDTQRWRVYNEVYYGLLSASNAFCTLRKAKMTCDPMPRNGGELLYAFVSPRIDDLGKTATIEEQAEITTAWLDIQADLCVLADVVMTADHLGYVLYEK